jgi:hypothetical protein
VELDTDEPAIVEAEACAVTVAERRPPRLVVRVRQARHQPGLDPAAMADDQGGGAIGHGLHDACPDASRSTSPGTYPEGSSTVSSTAKPIATAVSMARGDALATTKANGPSDSPT